MLAVLICITALIVGLLMAELICERRDRRRNPPPGCLAAGVHFIDKGAAEPTVILESGLTASSVSWVQTQKRIAEYARVIAYDRAGLGWSARSKRPLRLEDLVAGLNNFVSSETSPVILIGHSFGGLLVSVFAHLHPNKVGGVVLIDPVSIPTYTNPDATNAARLRRAEKLARRGAWLARLGIVRLSLSLVANGNSRLPNLIGRLSAGQGNSVLKRLAGEVAKLPSETHDAIRSHWSRAASFLLMAEYLRFLPEAARQAQSMPVPAHIPVVILSAATAKPAELAERNLLIQDRPFSRHTPVPGTSHWLQLDRPDLVAEAARELSLLVK